MKSYVYTITFQSGSVYVGKTNNPAQRIRSHKHRASHGTKTALYDAMRKYKNLWTFDVVFVAVTEESAFWAETLLISEAHSVRMKAVWAARKNKILLTDTPPDAKV